MLIHHCTIKCNKALIRTPTFCAGNDAGLAFADSNVLLNDTLIEKNEALYIAAIDVRRSSKVDINRCVIRENHAINVRTSRSDIGGEGAGIPIDKSSEVTMNDVTIKDNIADGNSGAIANDGKLTLGKGTIITRNIAKANSALDSSKSGTVNVSTGTYIYDNQDMQQPYQPVCNEGALNIIP